MKEMSSLAFPRVLALAIAFGSTAACSLNADLKHDCASDTDCNSGHVCSANVCVDPHTQPSSPIAGQPAPTVPNGPGVPNGPSEPGSVGPSLPSGPGSTPVTAPSSGGDPAPSGTPSAPTPPDPVSASPTEPGAPRAKVAAPWLLGRAFKSEPWSCSLSGEMASMLCTTGLEFMDDKTVLYSPNGNERLPERYTFENGNTLKLPDVTIPLPGGGTGPLEFDLRQGGVEFSFTRADQYYGNDSDKSSLHLSPGLIGRTFQSAVFQCIPFGQSMPVDCHTTVIVNESSKGIIRDGTDGPGVTTDIAFDGFVLSFPKMPIGDGTNLVLAFDVKVGGAGLTLHQRTGIPYRGGDLVAMP
jgi:hypothetical protein